MPLQSDPYLFADAPADRGEVQGPTAPFKLVKRHVVFDEAFWHEVGAAPIQGIDRAEEFATQVLAPRDVGRQCRDLNRGVDALCLWGPDVHGKLQCGLLLRLPARLWSWGVPRDGGLRFVAMAQP